MPSYTVLHILVGEEENVISSHVEADNPQQAFELAAMSHHDDQYEAWSLDEKDDGGIVFLLEDYVCVAVFSGQLENLK